MNLHIFKALVKIWKKKQLKNKINFYSCRISCWDNMKDLWIRFYLSYRLAYYVVRKSPTALQTPHHTSAVNIRCFIIYFFAVLN